MSAASEQVRFTATLVDPHRKMGSSTILRRAGQLEANPPIAVGLVDRDLVTLNVAIGVSRRCAGDFDGTLLIDGLHSRRIRREDQMIVPSARRGHG
jgi:hypothetical protein